jgi:predicted small integral membrane protein
MNMARVWPIVMQYGIGALLCAVGVWCGIRSGFLDLKSADGKRLLIVIVGGFLAMLALVCAFTFWLPFVPSEAATGVKEAIQ